MNSSNSDPRAALDAWTSAEAAGDPTTIDRFLTEDFLGVGPFGFVLSRSEWLERHAGGALRYSALGLDEVQVREDGDHAVAVARQVGDATYHGNPVPGTLRATVVLRRLPDGWRIAHVHTSFVAGTAGAPPLPGRR